MCADARRGLAQTRHALALAVNKRKALELASKYAQKGQLDKALAEYQKVLQGDPHDTQVRLRIGDLLLRKGEPAKAIQAYLQVATHLAGRGFEAKAVAIYKQVLKIDPNQADVRVRLGDLYQRLGLAQDALRELEQAAEYYRSRGAKQQAFELLRRVAGLNPDNVANRLSLANLLFREGMSDDAEEEYRGLIRHLAPDDRAEDRARAAEQMLEHFPEDEEALRAFASAKIQSGEATAAVERIRKIAPRRPDDIGIREILAEVLAASGDQAASQATYREIAELYKRRGDPERARDILQRYASLAPLGDEGVEFEEETPPSLVLTDELADQTPGTPSPGFAEEIELVPEDEAGEGVEDLIAEAKVALDMGDLGLAERRARNAIELEPLSDGARGVLAEICARRGDVEEAIRLTEERRSLAASVAEGDLLSEIESQLRAFTNLQQKDEPDTVESEISPSDSFDQLLASETPELEPEGSEDTGGTVSSVDLLDQSPDSVDRDADADETLPDIELILEDEQDRDAVGASVEPPRDVIAAVQPASGSDSMPDIEVEIVDERTPEQPTAATQAVEDIEEAEFLIEQGMLDEAERVLRGVLEQVPNHPQALLRLGELAASRGDAPDDAAGRRQPGRGPGVAGRDGMVRDHAPDAPNEENPFDLAAELESAMEEGDQGSGVEAAFGDSTVGGFTQLFASVKAGIEAQVGEGEYETRYDLGISYREMGLLEDAIREFDLASRGGSRQLQALSLLASCKVEVGRAGEAVEDLRGALKLARTDPEVALALRYELAGALAEAGEHDLAIKEYRRVQKISPEFREVDERVSELEARSS